MRHASDLLLLGQLKELDLVDGTGARYLRHCATHLGQAHSPVHFGRLDSGPGADPGTASELGFMAALNRPLLAYSNDPRTLLDRVAAGQPLRRRADSAWADTDGMEVEDFRLAENLMLEGAQRGAGFPIVVRACDPEMRFTDLAAFERCLSLAREQGRVL